MTIRQREAALAARLEQLRAELSGARERVPDPVEWWESVSGKRADDWQARFLRSNARRRLLDCGRQVGKTDTVSVDAAHKARFRARRVGILSPTLRQSGIMHRRCKALLLASQANISRVTLTEIELAGGGTIIAFPGDRPDLSVRGDTLDDLIIDEAAYVKDQMIAASSPTMATKPHATETMLGTPAGQRGQFYQEWSRGEGWERHRVSSHECPRIGREFLRRERIRLGPLFAQEYEGEFLAGTGSLFATEDLAFMFTAPFHEISLPDADPVKELAF